MSMKTLEIRLSTLGLFITFISCAAHAQISGKKIAVESANLCVTEGAVQNGGRLMVDAPKMRAYVNTWASQAIEAKFTYLGPTAEETKLGSGEIRRQFGLKLRAQNACNLVYAMWRIEPESKVVVSIKRNPEQTKSSECGNRGYQNIKPQHAAAVPALLPGDSHTLSAALDGDELQVFVDNRAVWEGSLGPDAQDLNGPVGIRSDNMRLAFDLTAGALVGMHPDFKLACKSGPDASD
jgi:hypothetical protein